MADANIEVPKPPETIKTVPLDAVIVCGMGPVALEDDLMISKAVNAINNLPYSDEEKKSLTNPLIAQAQIRNPVSTNLYNFFNAEAGKILAASGIAEKVILSGFASGKGKDGKTDIEQEMSEAELLDRTLSRAKLQNLPADQRIPPEGSVIKDEEARTTFANIINGLNILDKHAGGYFEGELAVLSSEFHSPRIVEMIKAFGLSNTKVLSAERVMMHAGYEMRNLPNVESYKKLEDDTYRGQPAGLQNLQDNPAYVMFELCQVNSDKRLWEMARAMKEYYGNESKLSQYYKDGFQQEYRAVFDLITQDFAEFDADNFRSILSPKLEAARQKLPKHGYTGEEYDYRELTSNFSSATDELLNLHPIQTLSSKYKK